MGTRIKFQRLSITTILLVLLMLGGVLLTPTALADPSDTNLDPTFGKDGWVITRLGNGWELTYAVAVQSDGKIVAAGATSSGGQGDDFALARYNTDGSLDTSFGSDGLVTTDFGSSKDDCANAIAIQPDGKIIVAGEAVGSDWISDFALARYNTDGSLDTSFGSGGLVTTDFGGDDLANAAAIQSDGKIVVVGTANISGDDNFALVRYNTDGSLDTSFGGGGLVTTDFGSGVSDEAEAVAIQPDGKIVAAGERSVDFAVARYNADGSLDTSFGSGGLVTTDFGGDDLANAAAIQSDGKIVVVGAANISGDDNFALVRYNTDGSLDTSFGSGGLVTTDFGSGVSDEAEAAAIQPDGKIVAAGERSGDFAVARYNADGSLDTSFGSGGLVTTDLNDYDAVNAIALQSNGKIVAVGEVRDVDWYRDFALARYDTSGNLDTAFDADGIVTTDFGMGNSSINDIAIQPDGKIVVAGSVYYGASPGSDFAVARYNINGSLDTAFGIGGVVTTDFGSGDDDRANAVVTQSDGKIVAVGRACDASGLCDFAVARYNTNGSLDTAFGSGGIVTTDFDDYDQANAVAIQSDGKIVATGRACDASGFDNFALARYNINGSLDTTFGIGGVVTTDFSSGDDDGANAVAIQSDGKIVAVGAVETSSDGDFAVVRYNTDGSLDTAFGTGGVVTTDFDSGNDDCANDILIQTDGKIIAVGETEYYDSDFALARYNVDGSLDTSFGFDGRVTTYFADDGYAKAVALQADGKIVVAGYAWTTSWYDDFALTRYNTDGSLDTTFGTDGRLITGYAGSGDQANAVAIQSDGKIVAAGDGSYNFALVRYWDQAPNIGFQPNTHGYSFPNYGGAYPITSAEYSVDEAMQMFGEDAVCNMIGGVCFPKYAAIKWIAKVNWQMNSGHCDGFTTTSLRFLKGLDNPADFQVGAGTAHDLQLKNVRQHIAYYWVLQVPNPVATARAQALQNTPSQVLAQVHSAMSSGAPDPTTLILYNSDLSSGHSVVPYAIDDRGGGLYWVQVYDNNHPDDANRHVEINTNNDTWNYDLGGVTWSGDNNSHSLGAIPISTYAEQPICPWCNGQWDLSGSQAGQVWLDGQGHLLISDSLGHQIGYIGDQFVNQVPGAYGSVPPGGLGVSSEPIYTLPLTDTYSILIDGQTVTQTTTVSLTQFGPGYAASVDGLTLEQSSQGLLTIAPTGSQLAYRATNGVEPTLALAMDDTGESYQLQVSSADIGAGQVVTLTADANNGQLVFSNAQASGGEYNLSISRVITTGEQSFIHAGVVISATDTHYLEYTAWDGSGPMTLHIDYGSDGSIDDTLELDNQMRRIWLPMILRNY